MRERPPPWPLPLTMFHDEADAPEVRVGARVGLVQDVPQDFAAAARAKTVRYLEQLVEQANRVFVDAPVSGVWTDETGRYAWAAGLARRRGEMTRGTA